MPIISVTVIAAEKLTFYTESFPPFNFKNQQGELTGASVDLLKAVLKEGSYQQSEYEINHVNWTRAYNIALHMPGSVVFSAARVDQREPFFYWVGPITDSPGAIFIKSSRTLDPNKANSYQYSAIKDDASVSRLLSLGVPIANIHYSYDFKNMVSQVKNNRTDGFAYGFYAGSWLLKQSGFKLNEFRVFKKLISRKVYFAMNLQTDIEAKNRFKSAFESFIKKNPDFIKERIHYYLQCAPDC
ncbi:substrate-binding periplasmic protein [Piscirickettsia litoralis]|uniref:substrate-binding periplasmic protein n=1 Tax=Piscirickettsia litoralis TaxID=1891921 RepID=UPI0013016C30|nr:transporter substrate-binding domain-containing protein [Piscirickettsia litoralis]